MVREGTLKLYWAEFSIQTDATILYCKVIGLHHPLDGVTNPEYKLLHFIQLTFFCKKKRALAFNWDRCCHLALCLWLILFLCMESQTSKKIDCLMARIACLVCLVSTVSGLHKNALGRGSTSSGHITKLEQSTFLQISMHSIHKATGPIFALSAKVCIFYSPTCKK